MKNILVIDDEPLNNKLIAVYLEEEPYTIVSVHSSKEAWTILHGDQEFDLILLDRMLPDIDGIEFTKMLKQDPLLKHIPIIMQTAAAEKQQITEGLQAGILHYITKPYDAQTLIDVIKSCV